jgi:hypothetical protein
VGGGAGDCIVRREISYCRVFNGNAGRGWLTPSQLRGLIHHLRGGEAGLIPHYHSDGHNGRCPQYIMFLQPAAPTLMIYIPMSLCVSSDETR